jgi:hypothetical protein
VDNPIKTLKKGEAVFPYWGKSFDKITGLDPLGQQNASERIYSHLLPGITNLTNRIRYFGFYSWILWQYEQLNQNNFNQKEHRIFIRRSEFAIALIMNKIDRGVAQIPGSNTANRVIDSEDKSGKIEIIPYTDNNKSGAYWKYSTGALGQYYVASLRQMGLVREMIAEGKLFYLVTDKDVPISGKELALAFQKNVHNEAAQKFLKVIKDGILNLHDVPEIYSSFNLSKVPPNTEEWHIYMKFLNGPNEPLVDQTKEYYRRDTIQIIKNQANSFPSGVNSSLFLDSFISWGLSETHEEFNTEFGWYQYRLNEFWQLSCGTIFWALLNILSSEKNGIYHKGSLIQEFLGRCFNNLSINPEVSVNQNFRSIEIDRLKKLYDEIHSDVKNSKPIQAGSSAINILLMLFSLEEKTASRYTEIINEKGIKSRGSFLNAVSRFFAESKFEKSLKQFFKEFIEQDVLLRHRIVAFNKLGVGSRSTLKFEIEDDRILYDGNFEPSFTNPRVDTLLKILNDLEILQVSGEEYIPGPEYESEK